MPDFDAQYLNLAAAGDRPAFDDAMDGDWPTSLYELVGSLVEFLQQEATSGSSVTIGDDPAVFTLDVPRTWKAGTPVYITEDGAPSTNFITGKLASDATSEGVITVDATSSEGSGTFTAWTVRALFAVTTVASPPLGLADGGTGASTAAGARTALTVRRCFEVLSILSTPPGSPTTGDRHLIGDAPTGAWASNENDIAEWNGSAWAFTTPAEGDSAYDFGEDDVYLYVDVALFTGGLWGDSKWRSLTQPPVRELDFVPSGPLTITAADLKMRKVWKIDPTAAAITVTMPNPSSAGVLGAEIVIVHTGTSNSVTINVASGGQIDGASSISLPSQYDSARLLALESGAPGRWLQL